MANTTTLLRLIMIDSKNVRDSLFGKRDINVILLSKELVTDVLHDDVVSCDDDEFQLEILLHIFGLRYDF